MSVEMLACQSVLLHSDHVRCDCVLGWKLQWHFIELCKLSQSLWITKMWTLQVALCQRSCHEQHHPVLQKTKLVSFLDRPLWLEAKNPMMTILL